MVMRDKIEELKKKAEERKKWASVKDLQIPFAILEGLENKLDTVEAGAQKNESAEVLYDKIKSLKIEADSLNGFTEKDFSLNTHEHNNLLRTDAFYEFEKSFKKDSATIVENIQNLYYDLKEHKHEEFDVFNKKIGEIRSSVKKLREDMRFMLDHSKLANLNWKKSGHKIDTDLEMGKHRVVNLGEPKEGSDGATKSYVDNMGQKAASMSRGGGTGIYVQTEEPTNVPENQLWIPI